MAVEIASADIVRIILQYMKEQNLIQSYEAIQKETGVNMNAVDSIESFRSDIQQGHWDTVLKSVRNLSIPTRKQIMLYEQIILELLEMREVGAARSLLRQTDIMARCRESDPDRYVRLESILSKPYFDAKEAYAGTTRDKQRSSVAQELAGEVMVAPPNRLLTLLGQALKWQQTKGLIPPGLEMDLFTGRAQIQEREEEGFVGRLARSIRLGKKNHAEVACFSPDGQYLASGSADGLIEIWNFMTGKHRKDLPYQADNNLMTMDPSKDKPDVFNAVSALNFSGDSDLIAAGDYEGYLKVWRLSNAELRRKIRISTQGGVTSVQFSRDNSRVLTACFDTKIRLHGLESGALMKEFKGHASFVNDACFSTDSHHVISASSDGSVRVWSVRTRDCLATIRLRKGADIPCLRIMFNPQNSEQLIICDRSNSLTMTTLKGQTVRSFQSPNESDRFVDVAATPKGSWLYALTARGLLYAFNMQTAKIDHKLSVLPSDDADTDMIGICQHPFKNLLGTYGDDSHIRLWQS